MVYVPAARKYGFDLQLHEAVMSEVLNSAGVRRLLASTASEVKVAVEAHARATAAADDAENYAASLLIEDSYSDALGFNFGGPYGLGNRPVSIVGVPAGRGSNPSAKPPLMTEAQTHALTSVRGFTVGSTGEDIR